MRIKIKETAVLEANFQNVRSDEILSRSVFLLLCPDQVLDCQSHFIFVLAQPALSSV